MSDDQLDDEAPPSIPDIGSQPEIAPIPELPAEIPPPVSAAEGPRVEFSSELDVEIDVEVESEPGEAVEPEELPPLPPPRKRMQTDPATPVARASMPPPADEAAVNAAPSSDSLRAPRPPSLSDADLDEPTTRLDENDDLEKTVRKLPDVSGLADLDEPTTQMSTTGSVRPMPPPGSVPPRPVSQPPRPVSQPPRPVAQAPRAVSQPPRPVSQPPPPPAPPVAAARPDSEPPTQPHNPAPEGGKSAATSYPPPPVATEDRTEAEAMPASLKPMRVIGVQAHPVKSVGAQALAPPLPPPAPPPPAPPPPRPAAEATPNAQPTPEPPEALDESDISFPADESQGPESVEAQDEGDISFPVDEKSEGDELTDDDIAVPVERESEPELAVDVDSESGKPPPPPPPPPPRREPPKPPSVAEAKEAQRTKQRKAWWEELFGEDFARANAKLKAGQIVHEADFIEESLGVAKGGVMLDLACGGGQHAVELAQRGYGVVGYDLSLYQLAVAADVAQDAGQKLNLLQGDMREMAFEEMFDGIYCWNTSFGYFEEEKNAAVAQRIFRALRPGGMFLLDVANRDFVVANQPAQTWFEGDACVCMDDMAVDFITSRLKVKRSLILDDGRTMECSYSIRLYSLHELGKILHDAGFRVTEASGHPSTPGVFFGGSSPRILILAQRP
ncbi:MAG: methyltransferase domain-containing protein [Polyangiaceae bacterium]|nr:methyltransferase domain-containing protein [Polyangiaceae bacterium]